MMTPKQILYLGPDRETIRACLESTGDRVIQTEANLNVRHELLTKTNLIVSYGYRHIIGPDVVNRFSHKIVNLHISLLPWNRGADPNVWSFLEDTPKGVSIHYIDSGIDTGDLLCQQEVRMNDEETLRSSYEKLATAIESLFIENWRAIRNGTVESKLQASEGSYHRMRDLDPYRHLLTENWDTPVSKLIGQALGAGKKTAYAI